MKFNIIDNIYQNISFGNFFMAETKYYYIEWNLVLLYIFQFFVIFEAERLCPVELSQFQHGGYHNEFAYGQWICIET
jgi:hypothetical protein